jgi:hypothetical protein
MARCTNPTGPQLQMGGNSQRTKMGRRDDFGLKGAGMGGRMGRKAASGKSGNVRRVPGKM